MLEDFPLPEEDADQDGVLGSLFRLKDTLIPPQPSKSGTGVCTTNALNISYRAFLQDDLTGCENIAELVAFGYEDSTRQGWNDFVQNYTYWDELTKSTMPYCEEALLDHVNDPKYCSSNSDTISAGYVDGYSDGDIEPEGCNPLTTTLPCTNFYQLYKKDTYQANCGDCSAAWTPFSFTLGSDELSAKPFSRHTL